MTSAKPLISVIMPLFNKAPYVGEAIESVLAQTYENWELIIVDDASYDRSRTVAQRYTSNRIRIEALATNSGSPSRPRNVALSLASGKYFLPLDADDLLTPDCLSRMVDAAERGLGDVITCQATYFGEASPPTKHPPIASREQMRHGNVVYNTSLCRVSDWQRYGGYDESLLTFEEDWAYFLNYVDEERFFYHIPEPLFYYRQLANSRNHQITHNRAARRQSLERIRAKHPALFAEAPWFEVSLPDRLRVAIYALFHSKVSTRKRLLECAEPKLPMTSASRIALAVAAGNGTPEALCGLTAMLDELPTLGFAALVLSGTAETEHTAALLEKATALGLDARFAQLAARASNPLHEGAVLAKQCLAADWILLLDGRETLCAPPNALKSVTANSRAALLWIAPATESAVSARPLIRATDYVGIDAYNNVVYVHHPHRTLTVDQLSVRAIAAEH